MSPHAHSPTPPPTPIYTPLMLMCTHVHIHTRSCCHTPTAWHTHMRTQPREHTQCHVCRDHVHCHMWAHTVPCVQAVVCACTHAQIVTRQQCPVCRMCTHSVTRVHTQCHMCRLPCTHTRALPHMSTVLCAVTSSCTCTPNSRVHALSHVHHHKCTNCHTGAQVMCICGHTCMHHLCTPLLCTRSIPPCLPCTRAVSLGDHRGPRAAP